MKISTASFYDRAASRMATLNARAETIQTQIADKKLTAASQDAPAWQRLGELRQGAADDGAYGANITLAQGILAQTDSTLGSVETQLARARELTVQANSGTLTASAREAIAGQLDGIAADLLSLANSRDARGTPLFAGSGGDQAFARDATGTVGFVGSGTATTIPIGADSSVQAGEDGRRIFGGADGANDIFATLSAMSGALRTQGADLSAAASVALSGIGASEAQATNARASAGARAARLDLEGARLDTVAIGREEARSAIEDTDIATAITDLQKTLTVLQATQASFAKLSSLSLFDVLR